MAHPSCLRAALSRPPASRITAVSGRNRCDWAAAKHPLMIVVASSRVIARIEVPFIKNLGAGNPGIQCRGGGAAPGCDTVRAVILTYRYRVKDASKATRRALRCQARSVNFVWNYCCQV